MSLGPSFNRLWAASATSNLGDGMRLVALPLLAATLTREPILIAAVTLAARLPWLLFALIGGAIVDRVDRRALMIRVQVARALIVGLIAASILLESHSIPLLCVAIFVLGLGEVLFDTSAQSVLPAVVEAGDLEKANSRLFAAELVTNQFAGQPLGGVLFAASHAGPFLFDAASFAAGALLLKGVRVVQPARERSASILQDIKEGVRWLFRHRVLRSLALITGVFNMTSTATEAILVLFALDKLGMQSIHFGFLFVPLPIGALLATPVTPRLSRALGPGRFLIWSQVLNGLLVIALGLTSHAVVFGTLWGISGFLTMAFNIVAVSLRQSIIPEHLLGRINSVYRLVAWGTMPIGAALGGLLANAFGVRSPFLIGGVLVVVLVVYSAFTVNNAAIEKARAESSHP